ncbi:hypothetical protein CPB86DRAFT_553513 [Serendipita vermifera]|nr:hypothetical protein CPB86DRAFT_553513 [Serendipita vermifera]
MFKLLAWSAISLCATGTLATISKRAPVSWSTEQCSTIFLLSSLNLDKAPLECAKISVPLDYADLSKGTISLQMARIPATQQPSRGGIFFNPGGPGGPGTLNIAQLGPVLAQDWGADWDYISWDPRGIWDSEPFLNHLTDAEKTEIWGETIHPGQYESHGNLTTDADADFYRSQASIVDQGLQKFDEVFKSKNGANLTYISTTSNVRDLVTMADALYGSDKDINFYGISYGTYMGMILTQMYPNRVGKVILDGVINPQANSQYIPILGIDEQLGDAAEVLQGFYNTCALAGPSKCPIAAQFPTSDAIKGAMNQLLDATYKNWNDGNGGVSYNQLALQGIFATSYWPTQWPDVAQALALGLNGSLSESAAMLKAKMEENRFKLPFLHGSSGSVWERGLKQDLDKRQLDVKHFGYLWHINYTLITIQCSDTPEVDPNIVTTERVFEETIRISRTVWPITASLHYAEHFCHRYTSRGVERYSGPWDVQPKNVVLVLGNQADPITPYRNAQLVTRLLGGKARLVQQAAYGHTTLALNSTCTTNTIKQYLQGTIPDDKGDDGPDVLCEVNEGPFGLPGSTPWNITTSKNGDKLTAGPEDPGLVNFPGLNVPPAVGGQDISDGNGQSQNDAVATSRFGWWAAIVAGFGTVLLIA